jgi:hypothetical protein
MLAARTDRLFKMISEAPLFRVMNWCRRVAS